MVAKLKTLLVCPRFGWLYDIKHPDMPLGIAYIAAMLRDYNKEVKIHDMSFDNSIEDFHKVLNDYKPNVVGIEVLSMNVEYAFQVAKIIKEFNKNIVVVVGGPHPTFQPEEMLNNENIDIAVQGEGEFTFIEILNKIENFEPFVNLKNIAFRQDSKVKINSRKEPIKNLDELPFPAIDLLPHKRYLSQPTIEPMPSPGINIITGRGCPFNCNFCQPISRKLFGVKHRARSPKNIIDEIIILKYKYNIKSFTIVDNLFVIDENYIMEFCQRLIKSKLNLKWRCNSRVNTISHKKLEYMKKAGCIAIIFGVESGSQRMLDLMNKGTTIKQIKNAFELCKKLKISTMANIMMGYPGETKESLDETINLIKEIQPEMLSISITSPMPGTRLFDEMKAQNRLNITSYEQFNRDFPEGIKRKNLSAKDLIAYRKKAYSEFYKTIFPRFIIHPYFLKNVLYRLWSLPFKESKKIIKNYLSLLISKEGHLRR